MDKRLLADVAKMFQSHAGSIEADPEIHKKEEKMTFQSHAGSIEAPTSHRNSRHNGRFQSHAGSIEAKRLGSGVRRGNWRFNPTLVRLRPISLNFLRGEQVEVSIPRWFD